MTDIYDIECMPDLFVYCSRNKDDPKRKHTFILHEERDDSEAFLEHLKKLKGQIGYNCSSYDYPILHHIMQMVEKTEHSEILCAIIIREAYKKSKEIFFDSEYRPLPFFAFRIPQLDLYKTWHFDNEARRTSLKSLAISMNLPNVSECPIPFEQESTSLEEALMVASYCMDDVDIVHALYLKSIDKLTLRRKVRDHYGFKNCLSWSDSKIGEKIMLSAYCKKTGHRPSEVQKWRTQYASLPLKDALKGQIAFRSAEFSSVLQKVRSTTLSSMSEDFQVRVIKKQFAYYLGIGGIHGCIEQGVYQADDEFIIEDADVASLYPRLAVVNRLYPKHLGEIFYDVYKDEIVEPRMKAKKEGDFLMSDGFKLASNSVYGKSNSNYSFLYDPMYTLSTTMSGQFQLLMLAEELTERIPDLTMLQINTDGLTVRMRRKDKPLYDTICGEWENKTGLNLEFASYMKMAIADVNNYIAIKKDGTSKEKGRYEVDKFVGNEPAYHKDNSFRIIPLAIREFVKIGKPVQETITNHANIFDFLGREKFKGDAYGLFYGIREGKIFSKRVSAHFRYCISEKGGHLVKHMNGKETKIHNPYKVFPVMRVNPLESFEHYQVNHAFYIKEALNQIMMFQNNQIRLFS